MSPVMNSVNKNVCHAATDTVKMAQLVQWLTADRAVTAVAPSMGRSVNETTAKTTAQRRSHVSNIVCHCGIFMTSLKVGFCLKLQIDSCLLIGCVSFISNSVGGGFPSRGVA